MPFPTSCPDARRVRRRHLLCLGLAAAAVPYAAHAATLPPPEVPIAALYRELLALMKLGSAVPFRDRFARAAPVIERSFDLPNILRASVGGAWATLDPETQQALTAAFRRFTIASYVASFDRYEGEQFQLEPDPRPVGADMVVQSRIIQSDGQPARLDYVMRRTENGWRAVDVLLDGTISRVAVQRSDFRAVLRQGPAALVGHLQRKAAELAGGDLSAS